MRMYTIKRRGKSILQNFLLNQELLGISAGFIFSRKKDAQIYLETLEHSELYEIIGLTADECVEDRRRVEDYFIY